MTLQHHLTGAGTAFGEKTADFVNQWIIKSWGGENYGHSNHAQAVKADQHPCQKALLQLCRRQLPSAGRRRGTFLCLVHQPVRNAKSASRISYQGQKTSATARTVLPSKSGRKLPSASAGNGQCSLKQVSGRSPDERYCFATVGV